MDIPGVSDDHLQQPQPIDFYPFAYALFDDNLAKHCWYCLDDENRHKRCTGCRRAMFCGQKCQLLAWKDHKFECRGIRAGSGKMPDIEVRLLGRIVARHKAILCGLDKKDPNFYTDRHSRRNIMDIWAHTKSIKEDGYAMRKFEDIYSRLCHFYDSKALLSKEVVFELHCRDFINRHAISDKHYLREIGKGLYLDLCAYDHSCRPNTVYSCCSFVATLRPLHSRVNMLDRSATFYSYIDLLCAKQDRRKLLKDTWYFNCDCERCADQSEHILTSMWCPHCPKNSPTRLCLFGQSDYKDNDTQLITCPRCGTTLKQESVLEAIAAMRFISDVLEKTDFERMDSEQAASMLEGMLAQFGAVLPPVNVFLCKIVQALLPHLPPGDAGRLLELHLLVEQCIRQCYPHNHPALAFHLRNIGIFAKGEKDKQEMAQRYLEEALEMFEFVMGKEHSLSTVTREILDEVKQKEDGIGKKNERRMEDEEERKRDDKKKKKKKKKKEGRKGKKGREEEEMDEKDEEEKEEGKKSKGKRKIKRRGKKEDEESGTDEEGKKHDEDERKKRREKKSEEERGGGRRGGTKTVAAGICLEIEPPPEDGGQPVEQEEMLVSSLVQMSINKAEEEEEDQEEEAGGRTKAMEEEDLDDDEEEGTEGRTKTTNARDAMAPGLLMSGEWMASSSIKSESYKLTVSSSAELSSDGGVKKKMQQKRGGRRRRTPLPPKQADGGDEDKSEASTMEDLVKKNGRG